MTVHISRVLLLSAAVALSACASQGGSSGASSASDERETARSAPAERRAAPADGTICRSIGSVAGKGKNDAYMCKASAVLNSAEAREVLDPSIRVSYGSTSGKTDVSRQSANATGKSVDATCQRAFLNAAKRFQSSATRYRKNAVRLVSFYDRKTKGGNEYECHVGTFHSYVVLKGSYH
ncbi:Uncharacterised protein [Kingella potus]|uniref:Lipoprotein n=1 Tax=Kingella potus TaxID=265175 RepID=A0A377R347_9NEIS|nr:hypothetical protein [Kingella potus]UOP00671.1 hypothetical protein LVJ84_12845 [Kingella potus]STR02931.1 Uncharacterised protein [Kingella potus]